MLVGCLAMQAALSNAQAVFSASNLSISTYPDGGPSNIVSAWDFSFGDGFEDVEVPEVVEGVDDGAEEGFGGVPLGELGVVGVFRAEVDGEFISHIASNACRAASKG